MNDFDAFVGLFPRLKQDILSELSSYGTIHVAWHTKP